MPSFVPTYHYVINDYMVFNANYASLMGVVYLVYYYLLEPTAAVSPHHNLSRTFKMSQHSNYSFSFFTHLKWSLLC